MLWNPSYLQKLIPRKVYSCKVYKQRHPRKFIPQNINFAVFLRGESSSRESFFPLKYKSFERDVSSRPIMLECEVNKHSRGIVVVLSTFPALFWRAVKKATSIHCLKTSVFCTCSHIESEYMMCSQYQSKLQKRKVNLLGGGLFRMARGLPQSNFIFFSGIFPLRGWVGRLKSAKKIWKSQ